MRLNGPVSCPIPVLQMPPMQFSVLIQCVNDELIVSTLPKQNDKPSKEKKHYLWILKSLLVTFGMICNLILSLQTSVLNRVCIIVSKCYHRYSSKSHVSIPPSSPSNYLTKSHYPRVLFLHLSSKSRAVIMVLHPVITPNVTPTLQHLQL